MAQKRTALLRKKIEDILERVDCDHIVFGGDFNFVMDAVNDSYGYACENNIKERKKLVSVCDKHSMIDIWRDQNPGKQQYT